MNKKAAFTYTFSVCRTGKNLFIKTGYSVEYKREEPVIAARCYGRSKGQQFRCRRSQQISTDQWKMRLSWILLLHTIETHGDTAGSGTGGKKHRPRCFDKIINRIDSNLEACRFLSGEKCYSRLCWMRQA